MYYYCCYYYFERNIVINHSKISLSQFLQVKPNSYFGRFVADSFLNFFFFFLCINKNVSAWVCELGRIISIHESRVIFLFVPPWSRLWPAGVCRVCWRTVVWLRLLSSAEASSPPPAICPMFSFAGRTRPADTWRVTWPAVRQTRCQTNFKHFKHLVQTLNEWFYTCMSLYDARSSLKTEITPDLVCL